ncbi:MAG: MBL fold metallo-hydrolase [Bacteroidales bacterium]|nr:MBL fold metallo-hydrolase [Bacteroidales bacterium]
MKLRNLSLLSLIACAMTACSSGQNDYEIFPIQDNLSPRMMGRTLFPDAPDSLIAELGLEEGIPASVSAFLVKTDGNEILFDAANGAPDSQLMPVLESLQTTADEVDYIFITHLHGDHIGGLLKEGEAVFSNALVYINKTEYDAWMAMEGRQSEGLRNICNAYGERVKTFTLEDELPCGIEAVEAYGHTPGHTAYRVGDALIAGDVMHGTALQARYPEFSAGFDMDKEMSVKTRRAILKMAEEGVKVYGMHFPAPYHL